MTGTPLPKPRAITEDVQKRMKIQTDFDLTPYNCFAVSCKAHAFCEATTPRQLLQALDYANQQNLSVLAVTYCLPAIIRAW